MEDWNWKPRYDSDLTQRCLTIVGLSWIFKLVALPALSVIGLQCLVHFPLELATTLLLFGAILKSSLQFSPQGKAVLITGKKMNAALLLLV